MANLERIYTIPLGQIYELIRNKRGKRAITFIRDFALRHMKADAVRISEGVNSAILRDGIQKPPRRIKVRIVKGEDSLARVWLIGEEEKAKEAAEKKTAVLQSKTAPIRAGGSNREDEESKKKEEKKADENKVEAKPAEKAAPASKPATASAPSPASKSTAPSAQPALQTAKPAAPSAQSPSAAKK